MNLPRTTLGSLVLLAIGSLGCLLGPGNDPDSMFDDFSNNDRQKEIERPDYDPPHYDSRDDPNHSEFRGAFSLDLSDDLDTKLDATKLGEATYTFVEDDGTDAPPHCLITLADRTPDTTGTQGYIILQFFGAGCPNPGTYDLNTLQEDATLKTVQIDRETDTESTFTSYTTATGTLTITRNERLSRLEGSLDATMRDKVVDGAPTTSSPLKLQGSFQAIYVDF